MESSLFTYIDATPHEPAAGPLHGKTVAIQPNMSVQSWPTEAGSMALENYVALEDATMVQKIRQTGATIKGSSRMSELGFGLNPDTAADIIRNGLADIALVTDTLGEARIAGAIGEAYAFKPSYGIISRFGLIGLVPSMECCGILARSLADIADILLAMTGADSRDPSMDVPGTDHVASELPPTSETSDAVRTLGLLKPARKQLDVAEADAFDAAVSRLGRAGLEIREIELTDYPLMRTVHQIIGSVEASSSAGKYDGVRYGHRSDSGRNWNEMYIHSRGESFGRLIKEYLFQGGYFQYQNYNAFLDACRVRTRLIRETETALDAVDAILLPMGNGGTCATTAENAGDVYDAFKLTLLANLTGQPALVLPDSADMPCGLQLIGKRLGDGRLLSAGHRISDILTGGTSS
jgi:aspartyl-tRNA(Asn)/glutamyl-tRNA(Gln) amidotransferase subunit A